MFVRPVRLGLFIVLLSTFFVGVYGEDSVRRVGVAVYTMHPSTHEPIMLIASAANPHFAWDGYTCCFPGIARDEEDSWEHNASKGLNEKTCYFFAKMLDDKNELRDEGLYSDYFDIRTESQEKAHQIICERLEHAKFMQVNEHSRLYFLYMPYKNFEAELSAQLIFDRYKQCRDRFDAMIISLDNSIRPGKYFHWVKVSRSTDNLELAFEDDVVEEDLGFGMSPFAISWDDCENIESFVELPPAEKEKMQWAFVEKKLLTEPGLEASKVLPALLGGLGAAGSCGLGSLFFKFSSNVTNMIAENEEMRRQRVEVPGFTVTFDPDTSGFDDFAPTVAKAWNIGGWVVSLLSPLVAYGCYKISKHFLVDIPYRRALGEFLWHWHSNKDLVPEQLHPIFEKLYEELGFDSPFNTLKLEYRISTACTFEVLDEVKEELRAVLVV